MQALHRMDLLIKTNQVLENAANPLFKTTNIQKYGYNEGKLNNEANEAQMVLNDVDNVFIKCQEDFSENVLCNNLTYSHFFRSNLNIQNIPFAAAYTGNTSFNSSSSNSSYTNHITQFSSDQNSSFIPHYHLSEGAVSDDMLNDEQEEPEFTLSTVVVPTTGIGLYILSLLTFVGNAMVLHAIRTDKRLQTVRKLFISVRFCSSTLFVSTCT